MACPLMYPSPMTNEEVLDEFRQAGALPPELAAIAAEDPGSRRLSA